MKDITSIYDIQTLVQNEPVDWRLYGDVSVKEKDNLRIFNYTAKAQYEGRWNFFERVCRGLIMDTETGKVVARPFDKFFNWGEGERYTEAKIRTVTEKMDGSLGILYWHKEHYHIATRGSFDSEQALWATEFLNANYDLSGLLDGTTLLFEIIYSDNRIVIDYQDREDLVLLAVQNRVTGRCFPFNTTMYIANQYGFNLPKVYSFENPTQLMDEMVSLPAHAEGWVVEFSDGQRFKFKGAEYRRLHKLISGLSFKNTLEYVANDTVSELLSVIPGEFLADVDRWLDEITNTVFDIAIETERAFSKAPKNTRKEFALWVNEYHKPLALYLFAMLDSKPIVPLIYKTAFRNCKSKIKLDNS